MTVSGHWAVPRGTAFALVLLVIFCAGGAYRLAAARRLDTFLAFKQASRDDYYEYGRNLRELGVLGILDRPSAFRGIVYPAALSFLETYDPGAEPRAPSAQALLGAASILLAAFLATQLYGLWGGLIAAALTAFHPLLRASVPGSRIEILFAFLMLLVALALARWARHPTPRNSILLGFAFSVSMLCRSVFFAFPLILAAAAWPLRIPGLRRKNILLLLLASYAFLMPWIIRNGVQFRSLIPFEQHAATRNFMAGALGYVENESGPFQDLLANEVDPKGVFDSNPTGRMFAIAVRRIVHAPVSYLGSSLRRLLFLLRLHPWLLLLALVTLFKRGSDPAVRVLGALCAYFIAIHSPMSVEPRYLEPLLPSFGVLAAGFLLIGPKADGVPSSIVASSCVLAVMIPLYALSVERLAREVALTAFPCLMPRGQLPSFYCGESYAAAGRWAEARDEYDWALRLGERRPEPTSLLAAQLQVSSALAALKGAPPAAAASIDETMRLYPDEVILKAIWLQDRRRYEDCVLLYDRLLLSYPRNPAYLSSRSVVYLLTGRDDAARRDLERSLEILPGNAHASLNYGMMLEKDGNSSGALRVYLAALALARKEALPAPEKPFQYLAMISQRIDELGRAQDADSSDKAVY